MEWRPVSERKNERLWSKIVQGGSQQALLLEVERLSERVKELENVVFRKGKFSATCRYYQIGKCNRAATCRYSHSPAISGNAASAQSSAIVEAVPLAILASQMEDSAPRGQPTRQHLQPEGKKKESKRQQQSSVAKKNDQEEKLVIHCDQDDDDEPDASVKALYAERDEAIRRAEIAASEDRRMAKECAAREQAFKDEKAQEEAAFIKLRSDVKQMSKGKVGHRAEARRAQFAEQLQAMRFARSSGAECDFCEFGCLKCLRGVPIDGTNGYEPVSLIDIDFEIDLRKS